MSTAADPPAGPGPDHELALGWVQGVPDGLSAYAPLHR
jgi:hypothetical protein